MVVVLIPYITSQDLCSVVQGKEYKEAGIEVSICKGEREGVESKGRIRVFINVYLLLQHHNNEYVPFNFKSSYLFKFGLQSNVIE